MQQSILENIPYILNWVEIRGGSWPVQSPDKMISFELLGNLGRVRWGIIIHEEDWPELRLESISVKEGQNHWL